MTTGKDDRTGVRVSYSPFRGASKELLHLQAEIQTLQANIAIKEATLRATAETESKRRTAFIVLYGLSAISLLFWILLAGSRLVFLLGTPFLISLVFGGFSCLIGLVREREESTPDYKSMLLEEYMRGIGSVMFVALYCIFMHLFHERLIVWLFLAVYCYALLMQTSAVRIRAGRSILSLKHRLKKAEAKAILLVSDPSPSMPNAADTSATDEAHDPGGAASEESPFARRR